MSNPYVTSPFLQFGAQIAAGPSTASTSNLLPRSSMEQVAVVSNPSANGTAFVKFGTSTEVASTTNGCAVLAGAQRMFSILPSFTSVAVALSSGTGTVYVSVGDGTHF